MEKIVAGDVVMLKLGSKKMVVSLVYTEKHWLSKIVVDVCTCYYKNEHNNFTFENLPMSVLVKVDPSAPTNTLEESIGFSPTLWSAAKTYINGVETRFVVYTDAEKTAVNEKAVGDGLIKFREGLHHSLQDSIFMKYLTESITEEERELRKECIKKLRTGNTNEDLIFNDQIKKEFVERLEELRSNIVEPDSV